MPLSDVNSLRAADKVQEFQHVVVVVERLARAHQHDVGDLLAAVLLHEQNFVQNLARGQIALFAVQAGRAELAAHAAADLRRDADGYAVLIMHQHGLHAVAVPHPPQVFHRAVYLTHLLARHLGHGQHEIFGQPRAQILGQIGHLFKGLHPLVKPFEDLSRAERLFAHVLQGGFQFFYC